MKPQQDSASGDTDVAHLAEHLAADIAWLRDEYGLHIASMLGAERELRRIPALQAELEAVTADALRAYTKLNGLHVSARAHRDRVRELEAERDELRADAMRWREMRRVFHVTETIGVSIGSPATKLSCHWHGWARGDHVDVSGCVDALIAERAADLAHMEQ